MLRSCYKVYFEHEIGGRYIVSAYQMEQGYTGDETCGISVFDLDVLDEIEDREIMFEDMFHAFCEACREYEKLFESEEESA